MSAVDPLLWLAHGLGLGHVPFAPGTAGALAGVVLALALDRLRWRTRVAALALLVLVALPVCGYGERAGPKDDRRIVADEMLTFPLATAALPLRGHPALLAGVFVLSRGLDVSKPPPARALEGLGGGPGIVLDDAVANAYTLALGLLGWHGYRRWRRRREPGSG